MKPGQCTDQETFTAKELESAEKGSLPVTSSSDVDSCTGIALWVPKVLSKGDVGSAGNGWSAAAEGPTAIPPWIYSFCDSEGPASSGFKKALMIASSTSTTFALPFSSAVGRRPYSSAPESTRTMLRISCWCIEK